MAVKPTILITGVSGNVGTRLLAHLGGFQVIGADIREPAGREAVFRFERIDLAEERSCDQLLELITAYRPEVVVHLAFVVDSPLKAGRDEKSMWHTNVAGTSRVIEAIAEHNRMTGGIEKFIFTSSAAVYGPDPGQPVTEDAPLQAWGLPWAEHQQEADRTVQDRAGDLRKCKTYILRSPLHGGSGATNYELLALRGVPVRRAAHLRKRGTRLPLWVPSRGNYLERKRQFVHAGDVARLIAHIVERRQADGPLTILNVAGQGEPLSLRQRAEIAGTRIQFLPGNALCRRAMSLLWDWGASDVPPQALPYLLGSCALDTTQLRLFLGEHYRSIIQHTGVEALVESLQSPASEDPGAVLKGSH